MKQLVLEKPTIKRKSEAIEFINEFIQHNSNINGTGALDSNINNYENWLASLSGKEKGVRTDGLYGSDTTYFAVRTSDDKIVGMVNIRHELNDYLFNYGGHVGNCVRPTERRKGYGTEILYLGAKKCLELGINKILITVSTKNIGSIKAIENNLGVLDNCIEKDSEKLFRYWIDTKKLLNSKKVSK